MGLIGKLVKGKNLGVVIRDMKPGEQGYCSAEELVFDLNQTPYLCLDAPLFHSKQQAIDYYGGTLIFIKKVGPLEGDYDVSIRGVKYDWRLNDIDYINDMGLFIKVNSFFNPGERNIHRAALKNLDEIGFGKHSREYVAPKTQKKKTLGNQTLSLKKKKIGIFENILQYFTKK